MNEFIAILNLFKELILMLFALRIPLSSTLSISWGSLVLGTLGLTLFINVLFRLFGEDANSSRKE